MEVIKLSLSLVGVSSCHVFEKLILLGLNMSKRRFWKCNSVQQLGKCQSTSQELIFLFYLQE